MLIFILMIFSPYVYSKNKIEIISLTGLVITKSNDKDIIDICKKWNLSKEDVNNIFNISREYDYSPYSSFYQTPCDINGKVKINNEIWDFYINGGGVITLKSNNIEKFLGCESKKCETFFILPFDGMNP
ncbi:hypothetical protein Xmau_02299 [Xenorhabdus mauleonii]|uniref:Uncharacterized protein n=2 Tax=Xenorhabdus mauleonii TaxID=351675 RepID=A0A1I3Q3V4_9GAMM|nr:hypothetical protein [Xenorhabdus mauleonii]PHM40112.1 hypothetical protein Xmau_02299 [Xenorhabdus mauleonii]SFJ27826.1 hypothetical protein SAMN05421680_1079 [Xenorhabdus mauleonii]